MRGGQWSERISERDERGGGRGERGAGWCEACNEKATSLRINARLAAERFFGDDGDVHRFRECARAATRAGERGAQKEETGRKEQRFLPKQRRH